MDALIGLSDSDSAGSDSDDQTVEEEAVKKQKKTEISLEKLQDCGYSSGPSVLFMKPPDDKPENTWQWSDGRSTKSKEDAVEKLEDRQANSIAVTTAVAESARFARLATEQAALLREQARQEKEDLANSKRLTFNQKEKRKRDTGQTARAKNYVEEEKRLGRQFGVYSGFD